MNHTSSTVTHSETICADRKHVLRHIFVGKPCFISIMLNSRPVLMLTLWFSTGCIWSCRLKRCCARSTVTVTEFSTFKNSPRSIQKPELCKFILRCHTSCKSYVTKLYQVNKQGRIRYEITRDSRELGLYCVFHCTYDVIAFNYVFYSA